LILVLGAAMRFQAVGSTRIVAPLQSDAGVYYLSALNIERWGVFSHEMPKVSPPKADAFVQPGLPLAITPLIDFPPTERMHFRINTAQALLSTLTILLCFAFFRQFSSPAISLSAALLTALSPHLVVMTTYLLTETLFTFLLTGGMFFAAHALRKQNTASAIAAGIFLGASALTRATTEYLPFLLLPALFLYTERRTFVRVVVPMAATALAMTVAWKLRNLAAVGSLSDPTLMVKTLQHGMYPDFMFNGIPQSRGVPYRFDPFSAQATSATAVLSELLQRATAEPLRYLHWYLIGKPISLLSWTLVDGIGDIYVYPIYTSPYLDRPFFQVTRLVMYFLHAPLSIAATLGGAIALIKPELLGLTRALRLPAVLIGLLLVYFFAIHIIGAPFQRYGIPLRPFVYGFGLFTLATLAQQIVARLQRKP
jgi:4-amino-4-deoxy-L-arabinose transferase-like glycosyltransferase